MTQKVVLLPVQGHPQRRCGILMLQVGASFQCLCVGLFYVVFHTVSTLCESLESERYSFICCSAFIKKSFMAKHSNVFIEPLIINLVHRRAPLNAQKHPALKHMGNSSRKTQCVPLLSTKKRKLELQFTQVY